MWSVVVADDDDDGGGFKWHYPVHLHPTIFTFFVISAVVYFCLAVIRSVYFLDKMASPETASCGNFQFSQSLHPVGLQPSRQRVNWEQRSAKSLKMFSANRLAFQHRVSVVLEMRFGRSRPPPRIFSQLLNLRLHDNVNFIKKPTWWVFSYYIWVGWHIQKTMFSSRR